jgi:hypothetical protein
MVQGQPLSLSFSVWCNVPGTYSVYLTNNGRDQSYVANFTVSSVLASSWIRVKIPAIPAFPTAGTWSYSEGTTGLYIGFGMLVGTQWRTANPNQWNSGIYCGTSSNSNLCTVVNNQLKVSGIKLEASSAVSYLQVNSFDADFWECIRYYWTSYSYQSTTAGPLGLNLIAQTAGNAAGSMLFPRRMAKVPTVTLASPTTNTASTLRNLTTAVDVTAFGAPIIYNKGITFSAAITTPASAKSDVLTAMVIADARLT